MKRALPLTALVALGAWSGCLLDAGGLQTQAVSPDSGGNSASPVGGAAASGSAPGSGQGSGGASGDAWTLGKDAGTGSGDAANSGSTSGSDAGAGGEDVPSGGGSSGSDESTGSGSAPSSDGTSGNDAGTGGEDAPSGGGTAGSDAGTGSDSASDSSEVSSGDTGLISSDGARSDGPAANDAGLDSGGGTSWQLVWSDEFDLATNSGADTTKWNVATWEPNTVNGERQKYTARPQNVFHDGRGHLVLRGLDDPWISNGTTYPYTSGRLQSDGKFQFRFGRVEVRAKLPAGRGSFPAILLMGTTGAWPQCGEIGMLEQWGQDKSWLYCSTYAGGASGDIGNQKVTFPDATTLSSDFHVYALEWYSDHMVFFIDDVQVARSTFDATSPFYTGMYYLILDVAIGGTMGGTVDDAGGFPMDLVLDYVRVYSQP